MCKKCVLSWSLGQTGLSGEGRRSSQILEPDLGWKLFPQLLKEHDAAMICFAQPLRQGDKIESLDTLLSGPGIPQMIRKKVLML